MISVDVWADVRCPWCWIGLRRLQRVGDGLNEPVRVRRRSFLLEPDGPVDPGRTTAEAAVSTWGMPPEQWESRSQHIGIEGRREGLVIKINTALIFDSNPVHRLLKLAAATQAVDTEAAWESAYAAHFGRNEDLGDPDVLRQLAAAWGLDGAETERALAGDRTGEVAGDLGEARRLRISSVPTIVSGDGRRISGVAPPEELVRFLTTEATVR
ncbi:MAG: DsbA family protein [Propionibacteriales bacterium]|nr:DsbA family protein [Propionibacteriales bacterium]